MLLLQPTLNGSEKRRERDSYFTPPSAIRALLPHVSHWPKIIWEPAAGDGAIVKFMETHGYQVIASDLIDHGGGYHSGEEFDFLQAPVARASTIITNPPFNLAKEFILKAAGLESRTARPSP